MSSTEAESDSGNVPVSGSTQCTVISTEGNSVVDAGTNSTLPSAGTLTTATEGSQDSQSDSAQLETLTGTTDLRLFILYVFLFRTYVELY